MFVIKFRDKVVGVSFTLEVEFEFITWVWVQDTTAETAFCSGLVVRSPGSCKALNQSIHNSLSHGRNVQNAISAVAWTQTQVVNSNSTSAVQDPQL